MLNIQPRIARYITQFSRKEIITLLKSAQTLYRASGLSIKKAYSIDPIGRILIVTPKKMGSAPERNRIRRRIKALFYQERLYDLGYNFVIYCAKESSHLSYKALQSIFSNALHIPLNNS